MFLFSYLVYNASRIPNLLTHLVSEVINECQCIALHACRGDSLLFLLFTLSWSNRCLSLLLVMASPHTFHLTPPLMRLSSGEKRHVCIRWSVFTCRTGCHVFRGVFGAACGWMKHWGCTETFLPLFNSETLTKDTLCLSTLLFGLSFSIFSQSWKCLLIKG